MRLTPFVSRLPTSIDELQAVHSLATGNAFVIAKVHWHLPVAQQMPHFSKSQGSHKTFDRIPAAFDVISPAECAQRAGVLRPISLLAQPPPREIADACE